MQDFCHIPALVLAEVEHLVLAWVAVLVGGCVALGIFHFLPYDAAGEVYVVIFLGEFCKLVHVVVEYAVGLFLHAGCIFVKLTHEYAISSLGVLVGTMGLEVFLHLPAAVELIGGGEVASFHLHKDGLCVDEAALGEIEVDAGSKELLGEHGNVEMVGVVACEVATLEFLFEGGCQLLEGGRILDIVVADACQLHYLGGNGLAWVDVKVLALFGSVGVHLDVGHLDDAIVYHVESGSLQVEDYQWFCKVQFHFLSSIFLLVVK